MSAKKQIIRREVKTSPILSEASVYPLLRRLYAARDIQSQQELNLSLKDLLPYDGLMGIKQAAECLAIAVTQNQRILIVGDFDADGATSTAVAIRALKSFGATNVNYLVPNRFAYGYGLTKELVEDAKALKPDVIITVDNGIANHAGVDAAIDAGIKVVITDHHLPAATLPNADVIVNPNQFHDTFKSKAMAGVGVIFYVMLALRRELLSIDWFAKSKIAEPNMSKLLDLVALGTVADLAAFDQNNRILVAQGLRRIRAGQCIPAFPALLELSKRDVREAQAQDLGFAVGARLNAAGRLDDMSLGIECLLTDDPHKAREIAKQLNVLNEERRGIEKDMQVQAFSILDKVSQKLQGVLPKGLCLYDASWHQGVIGILASRVKDKFHRPVIVFAPGQDGEIKGSARSISGFHIRDALSVINVQFPGLIMKFGGHAMAAGLTIASNVLGEFTEKFNQVAANELTDSQLEHVIYTDGELEAAELDIATAELLRNALPWGQGFPDPVFDNVFDILEQRIVGDKHLKLKLALNGKQIDAIAFFVDTNVWPNHRADRVRAAYKLDVNIYKNLRQLQLIVDHLEAV